MIMVVVFNTCRRTLLIRVEPAGAQSCNNTCMLVVGHHMHAAHAAAHKVQLSGQSAARQRLLSMPLRHTRHGPIHAAGRTICVQGQCASTA